MTAPGPAGICIAADPHGPHAASLDPPHHPLATPCPGVPNVSPVTGLPPVTDPPTRLHPFRPVTDSPLPPRCGVCGMPEEHSNHAVVLGPPGPRRPRPEFPIRVLRVIEYRYADARTATEDRLRWTDRSDPGWLGGRVRMTSAVFPLHFDDASADVPSGRMSQPTNDATPPLRELFRQHPEVPDRELDQRREGVRVSVACPQCNVPAGTECQEPGEIRMKADDGPVEYLHDVRVFAWMKANGR